MMPLSPPRISFFLWQEFGCAMSEWARDGCCPNVLFDPLPLHRRPLRSPANYIQYFKMRIICMIDRRCKDSLVFLMYFGLKQSQSERKESYARTQSIRWLCNFYMKPFSRQLFRSEKIRTPLRKKKFNIYGSALFTFEYFTGNNCV